jgi:hypothetical protein
VLRAVGAPVVLGGFDKLSPNGFVRDRKTVRAEPVGAPVVLVGFDKLSPNGFVRDRKTVRAEPVEAPVVLKPSACHQP